MSYRKGNMVKVQHLNTKQTRSRKTYFSNRHHTKTTSMARNLFWFFILPSKIRIVMWLVENKRPTWYHLLFLFHFLCAQHVSEINISIICVAGWSLQHEYHSKPTTPKHQHTSNQEHTTNVVIQQNSRKLLMMDILMSETCWAHKKWNKNSKWY